MMADIINFLSQSGTIVVLLAYIFTLWVALTLWTWFDISSRTDNIYYRLGALVLVALGSLLGFVIYLMLRPAQTKEEHQFRLLEEKVFESQSRAALCSNCGEAVESQFSFCVSCGTRVKKNCDGCGRQISHTWSVCPYCAYLQREVGELEVAETAETREVSGSGKPRFTALSLLKNLRVPRISLRKGGKKRGRPRKETQEVAKRPRGRPRKEISTASNQA